jgi:HAD superfamily hydrolase (TIGR01509 family)
MLLIANRLEVPANTKAIFWDMDGVIIDSLGLDVKIGNYLVKKYFGDKVVLSREYIKSLFAYDVSTFWKMILNEIKKKYNIIDAEKFYQQIFNEYNIARQQNKFSLNHGILEILEDARNIGLKMAVVSNNPTNDVKEILKNVGLEDDFDSVIGNDLDFQQNRFKKKPAPDTYLLAAKQLEVDLQFGIVIEDSDIGIRAGKAAGCFTIGVATGSLNFKQLLNMKKKGLVDDIYEYFKNKE